MSKKGSVMHKIVRSSSNIELLSFCSSDYITCCKLRTLPTMLSLPTLIIEKIFRLIKHLQSNSVKNLPKPT